MAYVHLHGYLGCDPDVRSLGDTICCTFPLADQARLRPRGEEREVQGQWYRVEFLGKPAEAIGPLLRKGREVVVHGQLELVRFQRSDGSEGFQPTVRRASVELVARRAERGDRSPC